MEKRPLELQFRLGPIPVAVEPTFWLTGILLEGLSGDPARMAAWIAIFFFSVLLHELGHAVAAFALGTRATVRLYAFGGLTFPEKRLSRGAEIAMSVAGPAAGFFLGGAALAATVLLRPQGDLARYVLEALIWVNVGWGVINLLPVLPLDGGHVLLGVLGPRRQAVAFIVGGVLGASIAVAAGTFRQIFTALLFGLLAWRNFQGFAAYRKAAARAGGATVAAGEVLEQGWQALGRGEDAEASGLAQRILESAIDPDDRNRARDLLAWSAMARGQRREALRQLERSEPPEAARALTWAMVLDSIDEPRRALPFALRAFEVEPSETSAMLALRLLLQEGRSDEALALVQRHAWPRPAARESALGEIAFAKGAFDAAAEHYGAAFEGDRHAADAYNAACSCARAGRPDEAVTWLERAVGAGFEDLDQLETDPDLSSLRGHPALVRLIASRRADPAGLP